MSRYRALTGLQPATTYYYQARSRDAAGNLGTMAGQLTTTTPDTTPPVISNLQHSVTTTSATITWTTNEDSDTQVYYGLTPSYGSQTSLDPALVLAHSRTLTGLQPATTYYYQARSRDAAGNLGTMAGRFPIRSPVVASSENQALQILQIKQFKILDFQSGGGA